VAGVLCRSAVAACGGRVAVARAPINAGWAVGVTRPEVVGAMEWNRVRVRVETQTETARPGDPDPPPSRRATCVTRAPDVSRLDTPRVAKRPPALCPRGRARDPRTHATSLYTPPSPSPHTVPVSPHCLPPPLVCLA
jgi:hypothetical protein